MTGVAPLFVGGGRGPPPPTSNCQHDHGLHHFHTENIAENEKTSRQELYAKGGCNLTSLTPYDPPCPTIGRTWHSLNIRPCSIMPDGVIAFGFF